MDKYIAVIDETGSNRPQVDEPTGFGVGAIVVPEALAGGVAGVADSIASLVEKGDFKYKHVQRCGEARSAFLKMMNGFSRRILAYAFYTTDAAMRREAERSDEAAGHYGAATHKAGALNTESLLRFYIQYMSQQLGAYASSNGIKIEVYWDRRNDMDVVADEWNKQMALASAHPAYRNIQKSILFGGEAAQGEYRQLARLAGVIAGDVKQFFTVEGPRIWAQLDESGLRGEVDPIYVNLVNHQAPAVLATVEAPLTGDDPKAASRHTTMLGGYYKRFLESDPDKHHLISFGDHDGRLGLLAIEHGSRWHVHQLPD